MALVQEKAQDRMQGSKSGLKYQVNSPYVRNRPNKLENLPCIGVQCQDAFEWWWNLHVH